MTEITADDQFTNSSGGADSVPDDQGPGWMPAIMAGTVLLGIITFIGCGVTTWWLFQKRTELAIRTLDATYIPVIEQSLLSPDEKKATLKHLNEFSKDLKRGSYENWQAGGVMMRLIRLPVAQWGDLAAVEGFIAKQPETFREDALMQLSRLRRGVDRDELTSLDFDYVLETVIKRDDSLRGQTLTDPMSKENVAVVITRADEVADRLKIPEKLHEDIWIDKLVAREINAGIEKGGM